MKKLAVIFALTISAACASRAQQPIPAAGEVFDLWPAGNIPGNITTKPESASGKEPARRLTNVSRPRLELFRSASKEPTGLVIICPGGGYQILSADNEGFSIANFVVERGISAAILWYRVPNNMKGALMDIQRAIRLARANAKQWNIDPEKICVMGFSAGANLCARASTRYKSREYEPVDAADKLSAKPSHTCLIYPAYCDAPTLRKLKISPSAKDEPAPDYNAEYKLAENLSVDADTPPAFIVQTLADKKYVNASLAYFLALKKAGAKANLFLCDDGAHGYGLCARRPDLLVAMWPALFEKWLASNGFKASK